MLPMIKTRPAGLFDASSNGNDAFTKLLLHFNGTDGATSTTDSSASANTMFFNGNAQLDTAQQKFGASSLLLDGSGDYVSAADSSDWAFGSGDFTVDFWVRFNSTTGSIAFFGQEVNASNRIICQGTSTTISFTGVSGGGVTFSYTGATSFSTGSWYHIAIDRFGSSFTCYVNGSDISWSGSFTSYPDLAGGFTVGRSLQAGGAIYLNGWIDEFRVSKGVSRYQGAASFTPPSSEYS